MTSSTSPLRASRSVVAAMTAVVALLAAIALASPAGASMTKTRIMDRDGETVIVSQEVGNQALPVQWVENDERRQTDAGTVLTYAIDRVELPPNISWADTEAAVESAVATFNAVRCGANLELVRVDTDPNENLGVFQQQVYGGGSTESVADITFAGWLPADFMVAAGFADSMGLTVPALYDADDGSVVWGFDVLDPNSTTTYTDVNNDRKLDLAGMEIYFNADADYVVDDDELGNTLFYIDLESIVLHELGHALGMDHFGRTKVIFDENGDFVDLVLNRNSTPMMNSNNYFVNREVSGSDRASFCGIYGSWGKGPAAP